MLFNEIFGISQDVDVFTYADSYMEQSDPTQANLVFQQIAGDSPDIVGLADEDGEIFAVSVFNPKNDDMPDDFWVVFINIVSSGAEFDNFNTIVKNLTADARIRIIQYNRDTFDSALVEYYSQKLVDTSFCDGCGRDRPSYRDLYPQDRVESLKLLLESVMESENFNLKGMSILEICCGNGFSTMALNALECDVLSIDIEKCDICDGLFHEVLAPNHAIFMDATRLGHVFGAQNKRFECTTGFMLGAIYPFNQALWENIIQNAFNVTKKGGILLFTVNKEEEIVILKNKLDSLGAVGTIQENPNSVSVYDKWIYVGRR